MTGTPSSGALSRRGLLALVAAGVGGLAGCGYRPGGGDLRWTVETATGPFGVDDVLATGGGRRRSPASGTLFTVNRSRRGYDFDAEEWGEHAEVAAYDPASGSQRWSQTAPPCGRPAVGDAALYLGHEDGRVTALDADGNVGWRASLDEFPRSIAAAGDRMYAMTDAGDLVAVAAADGGRLWQVSLGAGADETLAATPDGVVVHHAGDTESSGDAGRGTSTGTTAVTAFGADGERRWNAAVPGRRAGARPAVAGDAIVAATDDAVAVLASGSGTERWSAAVDYFRGRPAVADGTVYYAAGSALVARALDGGDQRWRSAGIHAGADGPAAAGEVVYVADDASLRALSADDGSARWAVEVGGASAGPFVVGETVIVATDEGEIRGHRRA